MTTPENTKPFDLLLAQQGHPLITRDGRSVKFIAYNPDVIYHQRIITKIDDEIVLYSNSGVQPLVALKQWDLFLAPVGYCEGLPVFPNDVLIGTDDNTAFKGKELVVEIHHNSFPKFKWPSKNVVVKTQLEYSELAEHYLHYGQARDIITSWSSICAENLANKAIERAISDGDVIPTSVVEKLAGDAYSMRQRVSASYTECIQQVLEEYKKGLK